MKKKLLIFLGIVAILAVGYTFGLFSDSGSASTSATAATLRVCQIEIIPQTLGNDLIPGSEGTFKVTFKNCGTIPATYEVKLSGIPDFLVLDNTVATGTIDPNEVKEVTFSWSIPEEADLGQGGQEINIRADVFLVQVTNP